MKRRTSPLLPLLLLLILAPALLALWFVTAYERRPVSVPVEPKLVEDRSLIPYDYKPLVVYLRASGHEVEILRGMRIYNRLPPAGGVLFLRRFPKDAGGRLHERLRRWMLEGGHLVTAVTQPVTAPERRFFARVGARLVGDKGDERDDGKDGGLIPQKHTPRTPGEGPLYLYAELDGHRIRLDLDDIKPEWTVAPGGKAEWALTGEMRHRDPPGEKKKDGGRRGPGRKRPARPEKPQKPEAGAPAQAAPPARKAGDVAGAAPADQGKTARKPTEKPTRKTARSVRDRNEGEGKLTQALEALDKATKQPPPLVPAGANLVQRHRVGAGTATLLSSTGVFLHDNLAKEDNAFLLTRILAGIQGGASGPAKVFLWLPDRGGAADSLVRRLVTSLPLTLAVTTLALLLLLWNRQTRLHPPLPLAMPARRDVLEYFTGSGRFAWRVNRARRLLAGNREALARHPARRGGPAAASPEDGRLRSAEERARAEDLALALDRPVNNEMDLVQVSRAMCRLSRPARGGGRG